MVFKQETTSGFTLLELAVLLTVTGLIMGVVVQYYTDYRHTWLIEENKGRMQQVATAIEYHNNKHGFYPCPAPRAVPGNNSAFGKATCPTPAALPVGTCVNGLCRVTTLRDTNGNGLFDDTVLIGGLPFKDLNMTVNLSMQDYLDTYKNQFTYAITESFTSAGYVPGEGAVGDFLVDWMTNSEVPYSGIDSYTGDYVLLSHGANGVGAYNLEGIQGKPCVGIAAEVENCNDTDAKFLSMARKKGQIEEDRGFGRGTVEGSAEMFDDFVVYSVDAGSSNHWAVDAARGLQNVNIGNIGVGTVTPEATFHVSAPDVGDAIMRSEETHGNDICDTTDSNCFDPEIIAGSGIDCGMAPLTGITQGTPECGGGMLLGVTPQICPGVDYVRAIDATGTIICAPYIP